MPREVCRTTAVGVRCWDQSSNFVRTASGRPDVLRHLTRRRALGGCHNSRPCIHDVLPTRPERRSRSRLACSGQAVRLGFAGYPEGPKRPQGPKGPLGHSVPLERGELGRPSGPEVLGNLSIRNGSGALWRRWVGMEGGGGRLARQGWCRSRGVRGVGCGVGTLLQEASAKAGSPTPPLPHYFWESGAKRDC